VPASPAVWGRQALVFYRYLSLALTSAFYLAGPPASPLIVKLGVVLALLLAARLAVHLYFGMGMSRGGTLCLTAAETAGIAALLWPTGGLDSPFVWYALNPIFMAASNLPAVYPWATLGFFLATGAGATTFFTGSLASMPGVVAEKTCLLLVFLLLTSAAQVFARLVRKLQDAYARLAEAHAATERSLQHISSLYQALEAFSVQEDKAHLAHLLAAYAQKLCNCPAACLLLRPEAGSQREPVLAVCAPDGPSPRVNWAGVMQRIWAHVEPGVFTATTLPAGESGRLLAVPVRSTGECFGLLGCLVLPDDETGPQREKALGFLANLGGIALERRKTEQLWGRLLVSEEQNRIANEIHDGVMQHLFSIAFAAHALSEKHAHLQDGDVQQKLALVKNAANQAARELRASIYRLSPCRRGEQVFVAGLASYLESMAELNGIEVDFRPEGSEEAVSPALRKALYRIVREATANAVRHGKCTRIQVMLKMAPGKVVLQVKDDGQGFAVGREAPGGLGLTNMRNLMASFGGGFSVDSAPGRGTRVTCVVPADDKNSTAYAGTGGVGVESRCG